MAVDIKQLADKWIIVKSKEVDVVSNYYCQTRDAFETKNSKMLNDLIKRGIDQNKVYLILAIIGEIGNNSFDHNLGNWPDIMGIFFGYQIDNKKLEIVLADRGQGVLKTLQSAKPKLKNNLEALKTAFTEKISGRMFENRGNGLKFVKESIKNIKAYLIFISGNAQIELNDEIKIIKIKQNVLGCLAVLKIKI